MQAKVCTKQRRRCTNILCQCGCKKELHGSESALVPSAAASTTVREKCSRYIKKICIPPPLSRRKGRRSLHMAPAEGHLLLICTAHIFPPPRPGTIFALVTASLHCTEEEKRAPLPTTFFLLLQKCNIANPLKTSVAAAAPKRHECI